jgi:hypothetical protein
MALRYKFEQKDENVKTTHHNRPIPTIGSKHTHVGETGVRPFQSEEEEIIDIKNNPSGLGNIGIRNEKYPNNSINIKLTRKEMESFEFAIFNLNKLLADLSVEQNTKMSILSPILSVKNKYVPKPKKINSYFINAQASNNNVLKLHKETGNKIGTDIRYDPRKETCPVDVRNMFWSYIKKKKLRIPGGILVDDFLSSIIGNNSNISNDKLLDTDKRIEWIFIKAVIP